jgi:enterochelin esterase-like enzyme
LSHNNIISPEIDPTTGEVVIRWVDDLTGQVPKLMGDHNNWLPEAGVPVDTNPSVTEWRFALPLNARIEYCFAHLDGKPIRDPLNPNIMYNGFGTMSELMMPEYVSHPALKLLRTGYKGSIMGCDEHQIPSVNLGYDVRFQVDTTLAGDGPNTMLIFKDGLDYIEFAHAREILAWLYDEEMIGPVTAVFVNPPNRHLTSMPSRRTEYDINPDYASFIATELVPWVEANYRTGGEATRRLIVGDSYGGVCALFVALNYPDIIGMAYSQSGYVGLRKDAIFERALNFGNKIRFCFDVGSFETKVGANMLDPDELDFYDANVRLHQTLTKAGIDHHFNIEPQGHTWGFWRDGLLRNLPIILNNA